MTPKKREWKPKFIERLRECGNVSEAARHAGVSRKTVYKERNSSEPFRDDWDDAMEEGVDALELEARRRASEGWEEPVFYEGRQVATVRKYSDTLLIFLLKGRRPDVFKDRQDVTSGGEKIRFTLNIGDRPDAGNG